MYDLGIVVAACNPHGDLYYDFHLESFKRAAELWPHDEYKIKLEIITDKDMPYPMFTKGIAVNEGIRNIVDECEYVAATDIDLLIPPASIRQAMNFHSDGGFEGMLCLMSHELHHWNKEFDYDDQGQWTDPMFPRMPIRFLCIGSWLSMKSEYWVRCGGFSEEYEGWGSDDHEVRERALLHGFEFEKDNSLIMHLAHPAREYTGRDNRRQNDAIRDDPARKVRNFMGQHRKPDFVIAGAQKAGTTTLCWMLDQHPEIYMPKMQPFPFECHHFDREENYKRGDDFYYSWFPSVLPESEGFGRWMGEKTPNYMADIETIERMHGSIPDSKIIVVLRDPISRAYSALNHIKTQREKWVGIDVMFSNKLDNEMHRQIVDCDPPTNPLLFFGLYFDRIKRLQELYGDKLLVLKYSDIKEDVCAVTNQVFDHLGAHRPELTARTSNSHPYDRPMRDADSAWLEDYYKESNEKLFELLGWESF